MHRSGYRKLTQCQKGACRPETFGVPGRPYRQRAWGRPFLPPIGPSPPENHAEVEAMRKFEALLAILLIAAGVAGIRSSAQDSVRGEWKARFESRAEGRSFYLELRTSSWNHSHSWGSTHEIGEFQGLDAKLASAEDSPTHFELRRDAGNFVFRSEERRVGKECRSGW